MQFGVTDLLVVRRKRTGANARAVGAEKRQQFAKPVRIQPLVHNFSDCHRAKRCVSNMLIEPAEVGMTAKYSHQTLAQHFNLCREHWAQQLVAKRAVCGCVWFKLR